MAIQVKCFFCGEQILVHSANIKVILLELDWQWIDIECPFCLGINSEVLRPIKPQFDKPKTPQEAKDERFDFKPGAVVSNAVAHVSNPEGVMG
jgi:hypothetical protein